MSQYAGTSQTGQQANFLRSQARAGLQDPHQVERDDAEHLAGIVGLLALRRHAVEGKSALEFAIDFLVGAASAHEGQQRAPGHLLVRHYVRVLEVAVVAFILYRALDTKKLRGNEYQ